MSDAHYDYVVVGRWRNRDMVNTVKQALRDAGKKVYCFTDNSYNADGIKFEDGGDPEAMIATTEKAIDWQTNPTFRQIFEADMKGLRAADALVLVFPSGLSAHMELGVAFGLGKKCYGIGQPEKPETLCLMFNGIYPDTKALLEHVA